MSEPEKIAMIGLGLMGHGIAKNILSKDYPLTVMDPYKSVDDLLGRGAKEAKTAAELAGISDIIFISVPGSDQVEEVVLGKDGIIENCRKGLIVVDCSTSRPDSTLQIAEQLKEKGGVFVDAPVTRTPKEAEEGRLNVMVGADDTTFARIRPVIEAFAENIYHIGSVGSGHKIKLINNFLAIGATLLTAEAATLATIYGVDLRKLFTLVSEGGANSTMFQMCMPWLLEGDETKAKFSINNAFKDISYLAQMAESQKDSFKLVKATQQTLAMSCEAGFGDNFLPRLTDAVAKIHGIKISRK